MMVTLISSHVYHSRHVPLATWTQDIPVITKLQYRNHAAVSHLAEEVAAGDCYNYEAYETRFPPSVHNTAGWFIVKLTHNCVALLLPWINGSTILRKCSVLCLVTF